MRANEQLIRRDGSGSWEDLSKEVKVALGRLEALFETEKALYTNMTLPTHFILSVEKRLDVNAGAGLNGITSLVINPNTPSVSPRKSVKAKELFADEKVVGPVRVSISMDVH